MIKMQLPGTMLTRRSKGDADFPIAVMMVGIVGFALLLGLAMGITGSYIPVIVLGSCVMIILILLRQDQLAAACILVLHLYVDWYLDTAIIAPILVGALLVIFFLARSQEHPWEKPQALWLWGIFLAFAIFPAVQGALSRFDAALYYPNIVFGALLMFWLGTVIARDITHLRRFFKLLGAIGALLAIITIIQYETGTLLFGTSRFDVFLASVSDFRIFQGSNVSRISSFFANPDWNGAFFAVMLCIPLSLFVESDSLLEKLLYLAEALVILPALLFTYSAGSWISAGLAIVAFIILSGRWSYRIWMLLFFAVAATTLFIGFSKQVSVLLQHGSDPTILALRQGAWKTAIKIIRAFPLTGIGLGLQAYLQRSQPYMVPEQYMPLAHPHNSYLELGAMAGLPVGASFVALLVFALWLALRNWLQADARQRSLIGGGIAAVIALSVNSFSVNCWTLPPLAAFGWMILGAISSPLLAKGLTGEKSEDLEVLPVKSLVD